MQCAPLAFIHNEWRRQRPTVVATEAIRKKVEKLPGGRYKNVPKLAQHFLFSKQ